jgi:hypothetical protein
LTPSGRSRRIKGYQKPGNKIPEKVVVIGDDLTEIHNHCLLITSKSCKY